MKHLKDYMDIRNPSKKFLGFIKAWTIMKKTIPQISYISVVDKLLDIFVWLIQIPDYPVDR